MTCFAKLAAIGATALLVLLALIGCESDADKIREVNESLRITHAHNISPYHIAEAN